GANAMTPIAIGDATALLLGPLIVEPVFRSQGIGEVLVNRSLEAAKAAGWSLVILVGDEPYYARMAGRPRPPALLRTRAGRLRGGAWGGSRTPHRIRNLTLVIEKILCRSGFIALSNAENSVLLASIRGSGRHPPGSRGRVGYRRAAAARSPARMADDRAGGHHLRIVVPGDRVLARLAVVGADRAWGLGHRLADEPAA